MRLRPKSDSLLDGRVPSPRPQPAVTAHKVKSAHPNQHACIIDYLGVAPVGSFARALSISRSLLKKRSTNRREHGSVIRKTRAAPHLGSHQPFGGSLPPAGPAYRGIPAQLPFARAAAKSLISARPALRGQTGAVPRLYPFIILSQSHTFLPVPSSGCQRPGSSSPQPHRPGINPRRKKAGRSSE